VVTNDSLGPGMCFEASRTSCRDLSQLLSFACKCTLCGACLGLAFPCCSANTQTHSSISLGCKLCIPQPWYLDFTKSNLQCKKQHCERHRLQQYHAGKKLAILAWARPGKVLPLHAGTAMLCHAGLHSRPHNTFSTHRKTAHSTQGCWQLQACSCRFSPTIA
jgi:hypothetical protein